MPQENLFQYIGKEFAPAHIRWLLVGGFAVNYHGVSRSTGDVDLLIDSADYPLAQQILARVGYKEFQRTDAFARLHCQNVYLIGVDFTLVDAGTFEKMWSAGIETRVGDVVMRVAALNHLLAMKLHALKHGPVGRQRKDRDDVRDLAAVHGLDLRSDEFRELCRRFADDTVYQLIARDLP